MLAKAVIKDRICFDFPEVHPEAFCSLEILRDVRLATDYPKSSHRLSDNFPLIEIGGTFAFAMHPAEGMWICFRPSYYPMAVKISTGASTP